MLQSYLERKAGRGKEAKDLSIISFFGQNFT